MKKHHLLASCLGVLFLGVVGSISPVYAQTTALDTLLHNDLPNVLITATRNARPLEVLPLPVSIIRKEQIRAAGSLRLNDVLAEQTGLAIISDHGTGLQMQGFNPDYTLILLDGEPLIGRTAGTLELSRIAVGNIERIEIVKGPSSSLYGSEALAGVVNIISNKAKSGQSGTANLRYGANNTLDAGLNYSTQGKKLGLSLFANRYQSAGYDLDESNPEATIDPFVNHTLQARLSWQTGKKSQLSLVGRWFAETQDQFFEVSREPSALEVSGKGTLKDWNLLPTWTFYPGKNLSVQTRFYVSRYATESVLSYTNKEVYDETFFIQQFTRPEVVGTYQFLPDHTLTVGLGRVGEQVEATRYESIQAYHTLYGFSQYEWLSTRKLALTAGLRYDRHNVYDGQLSPKLAAQYKLNPQFSLNASAGRGFKSPDFRQLYLNFTNSIAGYTVLGAVELQEGLERLRQQGQIAAILLDPNTLGSIHPESSTALNVGWRWAPQTELKFSGNFFYNAIEDLIQTQAVARKTNGQAVFSYFNVNRVFTRGMEAEAVWNIKSWLSLNVGYQYLEAKDRAVMDKLKQGEVYRRDPETLSTERVPKSDYGGLFNRSRHMANARLFFNHEPSGHSGSVRLIYRGSYGFADTNANSILDVQEEYVKGYAVVNLAAAKVLLKQQLRVQLGLDNVWNYRDPNFVPALPGRLWFVALEYNFSKSMTRL
jgi:outer membrane receptor for ferrienterochelin and colicins